MTSIIQTLFLSVVKTARCSLACVALVILFGPDTVAQDLKLKDWKPVSQLVVKQTKVMKPKFPVIDIHNHLGNLERGEQYLREMDEAGVLMCVSLDGRSKDDFYKKHLEDSRKVAGDRFIIFFAPDFSKIDEPDFG